jgi:hypothetical protein
MKKTLVLTLLGFSALVGAQVVYENGVCSLPYGEDTVEWGCTLVAAPLPEPEPDPIPEPEPEPDPLPEPEPVLPYSQIVAFGDSWTDDNRYTPWVEHLANDLGIPLTNYAVSGHRSYQIENQVYNAISAGIDPNALYTYWIFPNDFWDYQSNPFAAIPIIEQNAEDAFNALRNAGAQHILVLTLPSGSNIPILSAGGGIADLLLNQVDNVVISAAGSEAWIYDSGEYIDQREACWVDQNHLCEIIHIEIAMVLTNIIQNEVVPTAPINLRTLAQNSGI